MKRWPRILVLAEHDDLAASLQPLAEACRCILEDFRRLPAIEAAIQQTSLGVVVLQLSPDEESEPIGQLIQSSRAAHPDLGIVIVATGKLPEAQRPDWIARLMQLGASYVIFPPITEAVINDLITGLIDSQRRARQLKGLPGGQAIDLAEEGLADD